MGSARCLSRLMRSCFAQSPPGARQKPARGFSPDRPLCVAVLQMEPGTGTGRSGPSPALPPQCWGLGACPSPVGLTTLDLRVSRTVAGEKCSEVSVSCQDKGQCKGLPSSLSLSKEAGTHAGAHSCFGPHGTLTGGKAGGGQVCPRCFQPHRPGRNAPVRLRPGSESLPSPRPPGGRPRSAGGRRAVPQPQMSAVSAASARGTGAVSVYHNPVARLQHLQVMISAAPRGGGVGARKRGWVCRKVYTNY